MLMADEMVLHLIIRRWRTPSHSTKKELDDTHQVKEEILKRIGKKKYTKRVGDNPNLDITDDGVIILKGTGDFKKRPIYVTGISADEHFVLRFVPVADTDETEIQILLLSNDEEDNDDLQNIEHFDQMFVIPNEAGIISLLIDNLIQQYLKGTSRQQKDIVIFLSSEM